ncbi:hypothetical protein [Lacipirellula parvula]|uniref:Uncharacterized protein n=1 Tax=Lacipirellula parvula TaxID=2650471 RepID=A0A5K7X8R7_9BACT|nr:hypothetical protein [Lacipirellula parvula]BBO33194.1 hypothetical protein PLANPX_2806 [Lacipirellula parvula]
MPLSFIRRPRFTLRALLVAMAALCVAMWLHLDWIARRRAALHDERVTATPILDASGIEPRPPWLLGWFGETGQSLLIVHGYDADADWLREQSRLARLFPEAEIRRAVAESIFNDPQSHDAEPLRNVTPHR